MAQVQKRQRHKVELHLKREPSRMVTMRFPVWLHDTISEVKQALNENDDGANVTFSDLVREACYRMWYKPE